ncbi:MAG: sulfocyanin-like copper-binding protein [Gemmatimonadales bacterium]
MAGPRAPSTSTATIDGELVLTVPENSTVVLNFVNDDGTPHSAEVIADTNLMPNMAPTTRRSCRPTPRR